MIRTLLIEDLAVVRESLAMALAAHGLNLRSCSTHQEAIDLCTRSPGTVDVVLLKYPLGGRRHDLFLAFAAEHRLRVLVMAPFLSVFEQRRLVAAGVAGIFLKHRSLADLVASLRTVAAGLPLPAPQPPAGLVSHGILSPQQRHVAAFVMDGLANKQIASRMGVTESYIKAVIRRVFLKMQVNSRGQLVRVLLEKSSAAREVPPPSGVVLLRHTSLPVPKSGIPLSPKDLRE